MCKGSTHATVMFASRVWFVFSASVFYRQVGKFRRVKLKCHLSITSAAFVSFTMATRFAVSEQIGLIKRNPFSGRLFTLWIRQESFEIVWVLLAFLSSWNGSLLNLHAWKTLPDSVSPRNYFSKVTDIYRFITAVTHQLALTRYISTNLLKSKCIERVKMPMTYCLIDFVFDILKGSWRIILEICSNVFISFLFCSYILISCPMNCF